MAGYFGRGRPIAGGYIGNIPVPQALRNYDVFTATSGQTVFNVKSYDPSFIDVYQNGVKLIDGDDYTATDGNTVVLASGATLNDIVEVISFTTFYPADVVSASAGGTFFGPVSFDADVTPDSDATYDLGSSSKAWAEAHVDTVISTNVSDGTLSIPTTYVVNGPATAHADFQGTGTVSLSASFNISSLTDNGTGDYTLSFTNAFAQSIFSKSFSGGQGSSSVVLVYGPTASLSTSSIRMGCAVTSTLTTGDSSRVHFAAHGSIA